MGLGTIALHKRRSVHRSDLNSLDVGLCYLICSRVTIFTAIEEQMGLKLTSDKGTIEVLVMDYLEQPSENRTAEVSTVHRGRAAFPTDDVAWRTLPKVNSKFALSWNPPQDSPNTLSHPEFLQAD